jgi:tRNA G18 (ribose-2'-O)-methylase SpoU
VRVEELQEVTDPRVADYRGVRDPQWLRQRRRFIVESRQIIEILLTRADLEIESLLVTAAAFEALRPALGDRPDAVVYLVEPPLLRAIGGFSFHQGALALVKRPADRPLEELLPGLGSRARVVVLENVTNPDNVGSIFRNALAFGAAAVALDASCAHPFYRKALRTSMGAGMRLPFAIEGRALTVLDRLARAGFERVALTPEAGAQDIERAVEELRAAERLALVVGHETRGLSAETLGACDRRIRIPMAPGADSVNVATATGIALHRLAGL